MGAPRCHATRAQAAGTHPTHPGPPEGEPGFRLLHRGLRLPAPGESREGTPQGAGPHCPLAGVHVAVLVLVMVAESLLWASHSVPVLSSQTRTKLSGNADNAALWALALPGARGLGANEHARPLHATLADPDPR